MARDNTVKYQWRVLQLLPEAERPSYAGLRVDVLEQAGGELLICYQGEAVDYQEGPPPSSALWGADSGCSPDQELQQAIDGVVHSHLNEAQRERLAAALEQAPVEETESTASKVRGGKAKPVRHPLHRTPTSTQQARWEAVQQAKEQGPSLRAIARNLGMARDTVGKYLKAVSPPTKKLSVKERAKAEALAASLIAVDQPGVPYSLSN